MRYLPLDFPKRLNQKQLKAAMIIHSLTCSDYILVTTSVTTSVISH